MTSTLLKLAITLCLLFAVLAHAHAAIARSAALRSASTAGQYGSAPTCAPITTGPGYECSGTVLETNSDSLSACQSACCANNNCLYINSITYQDQSEGQTAITQHTAVLCSTSLRTPMTVHRCRRRRCRSPLVCSTAVVAVCSVHLSAVVQLYQRHCHQQRTVAADAHFGQPAHVSGARHRLRPNVHRHAAGHHHHSGLLRL